VITVTIDAVDVTAQIKMGSLRKEDNINNKVDRLSFTIESYTGNTFTPALDSEVLLYIDAVKQYGGRIVSFNESVQSDKLIQYEIECQDYSQDANRLLIQEQFEDESVEDIIDFLVTNYASDFTVANVSCSIVITSITFDRITLVQALDKLSKLTNFSYYIDYDKDIHFFQRSTEAAPFGLTDTSGNYVQDSIQISRDISQLRNRVFILGGDIRGESRTEKFNGDTVKKTFVLGNKFAELPTVTVGGVSKTVGLDFIDDEAGYDCFWSYSQKYIRFKDTTIPAAGTNNIEVTGIPLFRLAMRVEDPTSIDLYGIYEFAAEDRSITTREEAKTFGIAQLEAYADDIVEGGFKTYTPGLRSGQYITIQSDFRGWEESFLIQKVSLTMLNAETYVYNVQLATLRTVGIVDFLINLLLSGKENVGDASTEVLEKAIFETETVTFGEVTTVSLVHDPQTEDVTFTESTPAVNIDFGTYFVFGPYVPSGPSDQARLFILNGSPLT